jgi:hypothetical protein
LHSQNALVILTIAIEFDILQFDQILFLGTEVMRYLRGAIAIWVALVACWAMSTLETLGAAEKNSKNVPATPIELFAGIQSGDLNVKFIPKNDREATLQVQNSTNQPLSVTLPDAFVGMPVLAQAGLGGGGATRNRTGATQNQTVGG